MSQDKNVFFFGNVHHCKWHYKTKNVPKNGDFYLSTKKAILNKFVVSFYIISTQLG